MKSKIIISALSITLLSSVAMAKPASSEKHAASAVQFRQALLQLVRSNVGAMGAMSKDRIPMDAATLEKNATRIEQLSLMMDDYFAVDTRGFSVDTEALPDVWKNYGDFQAKITAMTDAAVALKTAAQSGDEAQLKSKIGGVFASCKGCHDEYKAD